MVVQKEEKPIDLADAGSLADETQDSIRLERRLLDWRTMLSFAVAFIILLLAFRSINVDPQEVIAHIRQANPVMYVAAFLVYYLSFPLRAWRWRILLSNVGYRREDNESLPGLRGLAEIIFMSWFANCIVPAKLGDAYRGYLIKRRGNVSFSRTMGTVLAERIVDMIALFVLMAITGLGIFRGRVPSVVEYLFLVGLGFVVLIVAVLTVMKRFGRQLESRLPQRAKGAYVRFEEGTLQSFRKLPLLGLLTVLVWLFEAGRLWLIITSLGLGDVGFFVVVFTSLAASLLTTLPVTPAGLGLVESGIVAILLFLNSLGTVQGLSESAATSVALLDRTISYWSIVVIGAVLYVLRRKR